MMTALVPKQVWVGSIPCQFDHATFVAELAAVDVHNANVLLRNRPGQDTDSTQYRTKSSDSKNSVDHTLDFESVSMNMYTALLCRHDVIQHRISI